MLIWDEAVEFCQWQTKDYTTETKDKFKLLMNMGYKEILAEFRRNQTVSTKTALTVADQRSYMMPPEFLMPKKVRAKIGATWYPVAIIDSEEEFDAIASQDRTSNRPSAAYFRFRFGVGGTEMLLDPIPSDDTTTIEISYEATDRDLSQDKYATGTISLTQGDSTVTGSGTTFVTAMAGRYLKVVGATGDGLWYRVQSRTSNTELELENYYAGASVSGVSFELAEAFALPEEMQVLPAYYAIWNYQSRRENEKETNKYFQLWNSGWDRAKDRYGVNRVGTKSVRTVGSGGRNFPVYPGHFPNGAI
jgi:hypothetical protein